MANLSLYLLSLIYVAAGIIHFVKPGLYMRAMPPWLPEKLALIYISGVFEIVLGLLVIPATTRVVAAWGLIALLIVIYPVNIQMAINYYRANNPYLWIAIVRLPIQFLLIWWAYSFTK